MTKRAEKNDVVVDATAMPDSTTPTTRMMSFGLVVRTVLVVAVLDIAVAPEAVAATAEAAALATTTIEIV